jgi:hypothetical protein
MFFILAGDTEAASRRRRSQMLTPSCPYLIDGYYLKDRASISARNSFFTGSKSVEAEAIRSLPSGADVCELRLYSHALLRGVIAEVQKELHFYPVILIFVKTETHNLRI